VEILDDLRFFYYDLNKLIVAYDMPIAWEKTPFTSWLPRDAQRGITYFQKQFYTCAPYVQTCNKNGEFIQKQKRLSFAYQSGIDIDENNSIIYIADYSHVTRLNLKLESLSEWKLPGTQDSSWSTFRGIKVDGNTLYLSIQNVHQIFVCNGEDGNILRIFGSTEKSPKDGEFNTPYGLTLNNKFLYICDRMNHRVQILTNENGIYVSKWGTGKQSTEQGQFDNPISIYNHVSEDLIYVGDRISVQLFRKSACIQRLGDNKYGRQITSFRAVYGICVVDDRLYVSDSNNLRILIFKHDFGGQV